MVNKSSGEVAWKDEQLNFVLDSPAQMAQVSVMYRDAELGRKNFTLKWTPAPQLAEEEMKISFRISAEEMRQMEGVGAKVRFDHLFCTSFRLILPVYWPRFCLILPLFLQVGRSKLGQYAKKAPTGDAQERLGQGRAAAKNKALAAKEKAAAAKAATSSAFLCHF